MAKNKDLLYQRLAAAQIELLEQQGQSEVQQYETILRYQITLGIALIIFACIAAVLFYFFKRYQIKTAAQQQLLKSGIGTALQMLQAGKK